MEIITILSLVISCSFAGYSVALYRELVAVKCELKISINEFKDSVMKSAKINESWANSVPTINDRLESLEFKVTAANPLNKMR